MTRRIAIIGSGRMSALVALVLADARMTVVDAQEHFPAIQNRDIRGPDLNRPPKRMAWRTPARTVEG